MGSEKNIVIENRTSVAIPLLEILAFPDFDTVGEDEWLIPELFILDQLHASLEQRVLARARRRCGGIEIRTKVHSKLPRRPEDERKITGWLTRGSTCQPKQAATTPPGSSCRFKISIVVSRYTNKKSFACKFAVVTFWMVTVLLASKVMTTSAPTCAICDCTALKLANRVWSD